MARTRHLIGAGVLAALLSIPLAGCGGGSDAAPTTTLDPSWRCTSLVSSLGLTASSTVAEAEAAVQRLDTTGDLEADEHAYLAKVAAALDDLPEGVAVGRSIDEVPCTLR